MNFAPYQWRAGEGYLPPPGSMAVPICPQPNYPYNHAPYPAPLRCYPEYPPYATGPGYPAGPAIAVPPPKPAPPVWAPPPAWAPYPPPPLKKKEEDGKTTIHSLAETGAPSVRPGVNYMYPEKKKHTYLHVFNKAANVWDEKYKGAALAFKIFKASTKYAVKDVVEHILKHKPEEGEGKPKWAVTQVFEQGTGEWQKGSTTEYASDKAKGDLASMGWTEKMGTELNPVWLVVHKI